MGPTVKIILIIIVFALITVLLFRNPTPQTSEPYDNMIEKYTGTGTDIDLHNLLSSGISRENVDAFKIYDQLDQQREGANYDMSSTLKRCDQATLNYNDEGQVIIDAAPNTMLQETCMMGNRMTASNDINGVCSREPLRLDKFTAYSNRPEMDSQQNDHNNFILMTPHMKTYSEVDECAGDLMDSQENESRQIIDYKNFSRDVKKHKDDILRTIRNEHKDNHDLDNIIKPVEYY